MKETKLASWADFERARGALEAERCAVAEALETTNVSQLLYRGQPDAADGLATTLERAGAKDMSLREYLRLIRSIRPEIETFTDRSWDIPDNVEELVKKSFPAPNPLALYEYMVYLRHHGFPSPLLDWTESPYVAAFFAFSKKSKADRVTIYVFQELVGYGKSYWAAAPHIHSLGPTIRAAKSHFYQRSQYTFCYREPEEDRKAVIFSRHEDAVTGSGDRSDLLWKFTLPASERQSVLESLREYTISRFSLFGTEDSLVESLAERHLG